MSAQSISAEDAGRISAKLSNVGQIFRALHRMAQRTEDLEDGEMLSIAVENMAKQGIRSLDACIEKLGGTPLGNFADEFKGDDETT